MAKIFTTFNPTLIVAVDTNVNELQFGASDLPPQVNTLTGAPGPNNFDARNPLVPVPAGMDKRMTLLIKVISGSFKFAVGKDPSSNTLTYVTNDQIPISVHNGVTNLFFKATTINDSFSVTA